MNKSEKIFVAGHRGMLGSAILRKLQKEGFENIVVRTSSELDLRNQAQVEAFFEKEKPSYVFMGAAMVGGIWANNVQRADFIYNNIQIQNNLIYFSWKNNVKKLLFPGSSCIYPKLAKQPIKEEYLLSGYLEDTNEPYALAKIAGLKMCESFHRQYGCNYISVMPTNLYGPNDNYNLTSSHVLPALIRKVHEAKEKKSAFVELWGTGSPLREFMHVDDVADACYYLMMTYNDPSIVNIGTGEEITIANLAALIKEVVGYSGELRYDSSKPDGTPRKLMDHSKLEGLGFKHRYSLREGIRLTYEDFKANLERYCK